MYGDFLKKNINQGTLGAKIPAYVQYGFSQVEPNHLSAQRTGQVYAQLPAAANINVLQQGQFVKYDYAHEEVNFGDNTGNDIPAAPGEWMLVFNEIKLYRDTQKDCEFAMIKDNYNARIYSPFGAYKHEGLQSRYYNGGTYEFGDETKTREKVTIPGDYYEPNYNEDPFHIEGRYDPKEMPTGTKMVPRVFKTNVGDIFTTNAVDDTTLAVGDILKIKTTGDKKGFLSTTGDDNTMEWQVVKVYTMPDLQPGVKIMRVK